MLITTAIAGPLTDEQARSIFFDWFCQDRYLPGKSRRLIRRLRQLMPSAKIPEDARVIFKNNCPASNKPLYDDLRICDEAGVIYTVIPLCSHSGQAEVWGRENDFAEAIVKGTWVEVQTFFREIKA